MRDAARLVPPPKAPQTTPERAVRPGSVTIRVQVRLPEGHVLAPAASSGVTVRAGERVFPAVFRDGIASISLEISQDEILHVEAMVYYCTSGRGSACYCYNPTLVVPLRPDEAGPSEVALAIEASA